MARHGVIVYVGQLTCTARLVQVHVCSHVHVLAVVRVKSFSTRHQLHQDIFQSLCALGQLKVCFFLLLYESLKIIMHQLPVKNYVVIHRIQYLRVAVVHATIQEIWPKNRTPQLKKRTIHGIRRLASRILTTATVACRCQCI